MASLAEEVFRAHLCFRSLVAYFIMEIVLVEEAALIEEVFRVNLYFMLLVVFMTFTLI